MCWMTKHIIEWTDQINVNGIAQNLEHWSNLYLNLIDSDLRKAGILLYTEDYDQFDCAFKKLYHMQIMGRVGLLA